MTDHYAVFGNPIAHSKSPLIHRRFAADCAQDLDYDARLAPLDGFAPAIRAFIAAGGRGANITVPFKEAAFRLADRRTPRAERAGAVNTLSFTPAGIVGDNTDGAGLVQDLAANLDCRLAGRRVLLLGAGGAARGVLGPLLDAGVETLLVANRSPDKAVALAADFGTDAVTGGGFDALTTAGAFDLVINATSASLGGERLPLPSGLFAPGALAYDLMYGRDETPFLAHCRELGVAHRHDGLGMLVEQAAEAFFVWRGVRPRTAAVIAALRG